MDPSPWQPGPGEGSALGADMEASMEDFTGVVMTVATLVTLAAGVQVMSQNQYVVARERLRLRRAAAWRRHDSQMEHLKKSNHRGSVKGRRKKARTTDRGFVDPCDQFFGDTPTFVRSDGSRHDELFHQTCGVPVDVFVEVLEALRDSLTFPCDATGARSMPPEAAVLWALNKLRTADASVQCQTRSGWGRSTMNNRFRLVITGIVSKLGPTYLPGFWSDEMRTARDAEMQYNADYGFPYCVGSLDAMVVSWGNCPKADQAKRKGHKGTGILVHGVAFHAGLAAHVDVGLGAAHNDIQALAADPLSQGFADGLGAVMGLVGAFVVKTVHLLVDGICPAGPAFAPPMGNPGNRRDVGLYNIVHVLLRTMIERLWGMVQGRFKIIRNGVKIDIRDKELIRLVVLACFILHNMIVVSRKGTLAPTRRSKDGVRHRPTLPEEVVHVSTPALHPPPHSFFSCPVLQLPWVALRGNGQTCPLLSPVPGFHRGTTGKTHALTRAFGRVTCTHRSPHLRTRSTPTVGPWAAPAVQKAPTPRAAGARTIGRLRWTCHPQTSTIGGE